MPGSTIIDLPCSEQEQLLFELRRARFGYLLALHIILLCAAGYTPTQTAAVLFCSRSSVYRAVKAYRAGSLDCLANGEQLHRACSLTPSLRRSLLALLNKAPATFGWCRTRWSCATLSKQMQVQRGVEVTTADSNVTRFQIIAGERRYKAANRAGLTELPASVKNLSDEDALDAQLIENLQRETIHPLDEADGFLRLKEVTKLEISDIVQRVAKDTWYVARMLALTDLIEEAREDFRGELITLAYALEICRLSPELQPYALAACYEKKYVWNEKEGTQDQVPAKEKPARHVKYLQAWIEQNIHLNLSKSPFKLDDARLREDGLTCIECPRRSGFNKSLFHDIRQTDVCLNPLCFQAKIQTFVQIRKSEIEAKSDKAAAYISPYYTPNRARDSLGTSEYRRIEQKADRCEYAEQAVYAEGEEVGKVIWICKEKTCKDHLGRVGASYSSSSAGSTSSGSHKGDSQETRNKRKQEIFDIKVDEEVRKRVMKEAIKTYGFPFERGHLNDVAKEFFRRIPSDDQKTICEVFGWKDELASKVRYDQGTVLRELAKLDETSLAQFMMLCSFAHYGANQYKNRQVDQKAVVELSKDRGVNHTLIDAQVRVELCAKKYRAGHQTYLNAVKDGRKAKKPVVYEEPPQEVTPRPERGKGRRSRQPGRPRARLRTHPLRPPAKGKPRSARMWAQEPQADGASLDE